MKDHQDVERGYGDVERVLTELVHGFEHRLDSIERTRRTFPRVGDSAAGRWAAGMHQEAVGAADAVTWCRDQVQRQLDDFRAVYGRGE